MQVYKITPTIDYSWGCALVAANTRDEAICVYVEERDYNKYSYAELKCVCNIVDKLTYDCVKPTFILDTINAE